jgi:HEAT repeat protein
MSTIVGGLTLSTLEADVPKTFDAPKQIGLLKNAKAAKDRAAAAEEIGRYGAMRASAVRDAIEPLLDALKNDSDGDVRRAAARALGNIAPDAATTVPALMEALKDKVVSVKLAAIGALGQYGPDGRPAVAALRELAAMKNDKKISQAAKGALKSISGKQKN